jgi:prepilin-type N-terminal cleavage/methylation domain-containing protein
MVFNDIFPKILRKKGFTLIELLISVSILILILSLSPFPQVSILRDYQISWEANYLEINLRDIQFASLYQKNDAFFGIKFSKDKYLLFEKNSQGEIEIFKLHLLPKGFQISGPEQIIFEKGTGKPSWEGIIRILEITKEDIILHKREISINSEGNIEILK